MTHSIKAGPKEQHRDLSPEFKEGDRVRLTKELKMDGKILPKGSVGSVVDVLVSKVTKDVDYFVTFKKFHAVPMLDRSEIERHAPSSTKMMPSNPPQLPDYLDKKI